MRDVRSMMSTRSVRIVRDVRPEQSQGLIESEHYGNCILEVWLEASRLVYCSLSEEI